MGFVVLAGLLGSSSLTFFSFWSLGTASAAISIGSLAAALCEARDLAVRLRMRRTRATMMNVTPAATPTAVPAVAPFDRPDLAGVRG